MGTKFSISSHTWIVAAGAFVAALLVPIPGEVELVRDLQNLAHAPAFLLATLVAATMLEASRLGHELPWERCYVRLALGAVGFALGTEALQIALPREASLADVGMNLLGVATGLGLIAGRRRSISRPLRSLGIGCSLAGIALMVGLSGRVLASHLERVRAFPLLVDGERCKHGSLLVAQSARIECGQDEARSEQHGRRRVRVEWEAGRWPGITLQGFKQDWTAYDKLVLELENPNENELVLTIRVHDRQHSFEFADRFNRTISLLPHQSSRIEIDLEDMRNAPTGRKMDLTAVREVMVFRSSDADATQASGMLYVSRIFLE